MRFRLSRLAVARWLMVAAAVLLLQACARNPVTQKMELDFIPEAREIAMGRENYLPLRQSSKGDYRADPALTAYVREVGKRIAAVADRHLPYEFVIVNSPEFNAWALPGGKIAVNRGLLQRLECEAELAAVLAHEIVHAAAGHGSAAMSRNMTLGIVGLAAGLVVDDADRLEMIRGALSVGGGLLLLKYGRDDELESDLYGMKYMAKAGYDPTGMVKLQETMKSLSTSEDAHWLSTMFSTHPPSSARLEQARAQLSSYPGAGNDLGCERYQEATAKLRKAVPAYDKYEAALKATEKGSYEEALALVEEAIAIEPDESLFHGLQARLLRAQDAPPERVLAALDRAVELNPGYWQHYLMRATIHEEMGDRKMARRDYRSSLRYLRTVEAYFSLGELYVQGGKKDKAVEYFLKAWEGSSKLSAQAGLRAARLDLKDNPGRYVTAEIRRDKQGMLHVQVYHDLGAKVHVGRVEILEMRGLSMRSRGVLEVNEWLTSEEYVELETGVGPIDPWDTIRFRARILDASLD